MSQSPDDRRRRARRAIVVTLAVIAILSLVFNAYLLMASGLTVVPHDNKPVVVDQLPVKEAT